MKRSIARLVCSVFLCCALLVVCAELLSAYGAGSSEDPLITYSYVQKTFLPKLLEGPEKDAAELLADETREKELKSHGDAVVADLTYENLADAAAVRMLVSVGELSIPSVTGQRKVKLDSGLAVVAEEGATVTVLGGSIKAVPESSGTIILVGARKELETETELALGDYAVTGSSSKDSLVLSQILL